MNPTPYVMIPRAVFDGLYKCSLTMAQFHILVFCYFQADRVSYRVQGYSAEAVCLWLGLDAENKLLAQYRRAAKDLKERNILRGDYRKCSVNPSRPDKGGRSYSVWVPRPELFLGVGTAEENKLSLWSGHVRLPDTNNVRQVDAANLDIPTTSANNETDNVRLIEPRNDDGMFILTSKAPQNPEKDPLNLPSGDFSPAPLPLKGEDAQAAGLLKPTQGKPAGRENLNPLNERRCELLDKAALLYVDFSVWLYDFSPDTSHVRTLLRKYTPNELLFAQINRFSPSEKVVKSSMAHFFRKAAEDAIESARIKETSKTAPEWLTATFLGRDNLSARFGFISRKEFSERWKSVTAAWLEAFPKKKILGDDRLESGGAK